MEQKSERNNHNSSTGDDEAWHTTRRSSYPTLHSRLDQSDRPTALPIGPLPPLEERPSLTTTTRPPRKVSETNMLVVSSSISAC